MTILQRISIADIFPPPTIDDVRALLLEFVATGQNPVTDWHSGAILRTMFELEALVQQDFVANTLNAVIANGYPNPSGGATGDSQTLLAHGWYEVDRSQGTTAIQTITLACDAQHGPYTIIGGRIYLAPDGASYTGLAGGALSTGGTLTFDVGGMSPAAARSLVSALAERLPGVTVQAAAIKVISGVPQSGSDPDSDASLFTVTDGRFTDLDADPDETDRVAAWALAAGTSTTRTRIDPSTTVPGVIILTLANGTGGIPGGEVTTVQAYVDARRFDTIIAQAATNAAVTAGGTVLYPSSWSAAQLTAAQTAADAAWANVLATNKIGGLVELAQLVQSVMDQGTVDFTNPTLNGTGADLVLAATQVPHAAGSLAAELTWSPF